MERPSSRLGRPRARLAAAAFAIAALALGCAHGGGSGLIAAPAQGAWVVVPHIELVAQKDTDDCGPAALATALGRWGKTLPASGATDVPPDGQGVTAGALRDEARRLGFTSFVFEGSFADLAVELDARRPVVVGLVHEDGARRAAHFAVVVGRDARAGRWLLADPARGVRDLSEDALRGDWARAGWVTLVLLPKEPADEGATKPDDGAPRAAL